MLVLMAMSLRKHLVMLPIRLGSRLLRELPMFGRAMKVVMSSPVVSLSRLPMVPMPLVLLFSMMFIVAISGAMTACLPLPMAIPLALRPARLTASMRRLSPFRSLSSGVASLLSAQAIPVETGSRWLALFPQQILALLAP